MIDRVHISNISGETKVKPLERLSPVRQTEDILKHPEQPMQEEQFKRKVDKERMEEVVQGMNQFLTPVHTSMKFELHDKLNDYYVTVVNDDTNEVIKEIPSKQLLDTYANMLEFVGLLVDEKI